MRNICWILWLPLLAAIGPVMSSAEIQSLYQNKDQVRQYEKFEVSFQLDSKFDNPFDPDEIDIQAVFHQPDGQSLTLPAFYYQPFGESGDESNPFQSAGPACWKVRFSPMQLGKHTYEIQERECGKFIASTTGSFCCIEGTRRGFIRRDPRDVRFLCFDDSTAYIPIGHNTCWNEKDGIAIWKNFFQKMGSNGENWARIWMTHFYEGHTLEWSRSHYVPYFQGLGRYSLVMAWKIDQILEAAEKNGIFLQLVLQHHGQFSTGEDTNWKENPYNIIHPEDGGFLEKPEEFFYNVKAKELIQRKYRYLIARWGYSPNILAWELFNEVQHTDSLKDNPIQQANVLQWHIEMSSFLRETDPFNHLITTSSAIQGMEPAWNLDNIDLVQVHYYGQPVIDPFIGKAQWLFQHNKPVLVAEYGLSGNGIPELKPDDQGNPLKADQIREGLHLHNGIWAASHLASGAMLWWWDYIDQNQLYPAFLPLAKYWEGEDPAAYRLGPAQVTLEGGPKRPGLFLQGGQTGFFTPSGKSEFWIDPKADLAKEMEPLSVWLHGEAQSNLRISPAFHINLPGSGQVNVFVEAVSGHGSNSLRVKANGKELLSKKLLSGGNSLTLSVPLEAGEHVVQLENTGDDWIKLRGIEIAGYDQWAAQCIGLSGADHAYLWIYDTDSQYGRQSNGKFSQVNVVLEGLVDGNYQIDVYQTRGAGGMVASFQQTCHAGRLRFEIPEFEKDVAIKIRRI